jgi:hypothetical protein
MTKPNQRERIVQPRCGEGHPDGEGCNHSLSFHKQGGRCRALGCNCTTWVEPVEIGSSDPAVVG